MKISKILAGMSAAAMVASMAIMPAAAVDNQTLWCAKDWKNEQNFFADNHDSKSKWNGAWLQFYTKDSDLSGATITITIDTTNSVWEDEKDESGAATGKTVYEAGNYCVIKAFDTVDDSETLHIAKFEDGASAGNMNVTNDNGVFTVTIDGAELTKAVDEGTLAPSEEDAPDGSKVYNCGFNVQFGHYDNATYTATVSGDNVLPLTSVTDENDKVTCSVDWEKAGYTADSSAASGTDSKSESKTDSKTDSTSSAASTTSSKAATTTTTKTSTAATSSAAASDNTAETGATAGLALAGIALAGAAIVVSKRK